MRPLPIPAEYLIQNFGGLLRFECIQFVEVGTIRFISDDSLRVVHCAQNEITPARVTRVNYVFRLVVTVSDSVLFQLVA
jgi:hypothetical protein